MIRANTRGRLTAADLQLVILLLSRGSAHRRAYLERRLASEGPDSLLDAPDLLERLLTVRSMLVEGGAGLAGRLLQRALVDRMVIFRTPVTLGAARSGAPPTAARRAPGPPRASAQVARDRLERRFRR